MGFFGAHKEIHKKQKKIKNSVGFSNRPRKFWWEFLVTKFVQNFTRTKFPFKITLAKTKVKEHTWFHDAPRFGSTSLKKMSRSKGGFEGGEGGGSEQKKCNSGSGWLSWDTTGGCLGWARLETLIK